MSLEVTCRLHSDAQCDRTDRLRVLAPTLRASDVVVMTISAPIASKAQPGDGTDDTDERRTLPFSADLVTLRP
jgi:hypothetical protein